MANTSIVVAVAVLGHGGGVVDGDRGVRRHRSPSPTTVAVEPPGVRV